MAVVGTAYYSMKLIFLAFYVSPLGYKRSVVSVVESG